MEKSNGKWWKGMKGIVFMKDTKGYEGYEGVFLVMNVERMNICFWKTLEKNVGFRSGVFLLDVLGCWFHFLFKGFQLRMYTR